MFRDKLEKLINKQNEKDENENGNLKNKKKIENLVFFIIIAIITIVIINIIWNGKKTSTKQNINTTGKQLATTNPQNNLIDSGNIYSGTSADNLEQKLEVILSKIQGVGDVNVFINYSQSSEVIAMYNENSKVSTTEEADTSGGTRKIQETDTQKDIIYKEDNNRRKNTNNTKNNTTKSRRSNNNSKRGWKRHSKNKYNTGSRSCYWIGYT